VIKLIYALVAAVVAGILGIIANASPEGAEYISRLRLLFLGAAVIGYLGLAVFVWKERKGILRWISLLVALLAVRILYVFVVNLAVILTGWLEAAARGAGVENTALLVHLALAIFTSVFASLVAMLGDGIVDNIMKKIRWAILAAVIAGAGVQDFSHPEDRRILPQRFGSEAPAQATYGQDYKTVVKDKDRSFRVRLGAVFGTVRHSISPSDGWGGSVRDDLLARYRSEPDGSMSDGFAALEASLLKARPTLKAPES
jgi:hypothetical protein